MGDLLWLDDVVSWWWKWNRYHSDLFLLLYSSSVILSSKSLAIVVYTLKFCQIKTDGMKEPRATSSHSIENAFALASVRLWPWKQSKNFKGRIYFSGLEGNGYGSKPPLGLERESWLEESRGNGIHRSFCVTNDLNQPRMSTEAYRVAVENLCDCSMVL